MLYTVNGSNRQRDVYFILGVEEKGVWWMGGV